MMSEELIGVCWTMPLAESTQAWYIYEGRKTLLQGSRIRKSGSKSLSLFQSLYAKGGPVKAKGWAIVVEIDKETVRNNVQCEHAKACRRDFSFQTLYATGNC